MSRVSKQSDVGGIQQKNGGSFAKALSVKVYLFTRVCLLVWIVGPFMALLKLINNGAGQHPLPSSIHRAPSISGPGGNRLSLLVLPSFSIRFGRLSQLMSP